MLVTERPGRVRIFDSGHPWQRPGGDGDDPGLGVGRGRPDGHRGRRGLRMRTGTCSLISAVATGSGGRDERGSRTGTPARRSSGSTTGSSQTAWRPTRSTTAARWRWTDSACCGSPWAMPRNEARAQDPGSLNGKVLRVNTNGSIPGDNPVIAGTVAVTRCYSMGLATRRASPSGRGPSQVYARARTGPQRRDRTCSFPAATSVGPATPGRGRHITPAAASPPRAITNRSGHRAARRSPHREQPSRRAHSGATTTGTFGSARSRRATSVASASTRPGRP